ncbi:MAG: Gfo/Idh/MocA family oxidoreductase, partial [Actinobacteria bacterium]|nr:Gfo/Idh/MocA family oxidoreductase [Actinomycetota bacterium]
MPHRFALIGCGGMGRRHLRGFATLAQVRPGLVELAAVVDVAEERAAFLAGEAEELLGRRPAVFQTLEAAARGTPDLEAVDIVTVASTHHVLAPQALELGLHVLVEKPVAVTVRGGRRVIDTARRTGKLVSVAENYRRDPMARLARALIDARAVGVPRSVLDLHFGGGDRL